MSQRLVQGVPTATHNRSKWDNMNESMNQLTPTDIVFHQIGLRVNYSEGCFFMQTLNI